MGILHDTTTPAMPSHKNAKFCQFKGQKGIQGAAGLAPRVTTIHPTTHPTAKVVI